jgi:hypothetical protein
MQDYQARVGTSFALAVMTDRLRQAQERFSIANSAAGRLESAIEEIVSDEDMEEFELMADLWKEKQLTVCREIEAQIAAIKECEPVKGTGTQEQIDQLGLNWNLEYTHCRLEEQFEYHYGAGRR